MKKFQFFQMMMHKFSLKHSSLSRLWSKLTLALGLGLLLAGCEPEIPENDEVIAPMSDVPAIVSAELVQEEGAFWLKLVVEDGDGNIGSTDPDDPILEVVDLREENIITYYPVPPLAPTNESVSIRAHFDVEMVQPEVSVNGSNAWRVEIRIRDTDMQWSSKVVSNTLSLN